jgi:hypothetical protein
LSTGEASSPNQKRRRRAWVSIWSLLVVLLALQPIAFALVDVILPSHPVVLSYESWAQYLRSPVPDVVFIGTSRVGSDIDRQAIADTMSRSLGRTATVGFIAAGAGMPYFEDAVAYRVMHRPNHPRLVVFEMAEFQYNANFAPDNIPDLWMISRAGDLDFERFTLSVVPDPGRYVRGLIFPLFAYYKLLAFGVSQSLIPLTISIQRVGHFLHHGQLADPYIDFSTAGAVASGSHVMTADEETSVLFEYSSTVLRDYRFEPDRLARLSEAISVVRAAGGEVALAILPENKIDRLVPAGYEDFLSSARAFATSRQAPLLDYHTLYQQERAMWSDPSHLNSYGRLALSGELGAGVAPLL